jgi:fumarylacetoacetate (FAA) hydrolase
MKLATLKNGSRDGALGIGSQDLSKYADTSDIAPTLQAALDAWATMAPRLKTLSEALESGDAPSMPFDQSAVESPLPRAYQWADGSAYINHVELVRKARGAEVPASFYDDPLMYQGVSGPNLAPHDPIPFTDMAWGYDMEGEIAVITDDVPLGVSETDALGHIKLILLCNDVSLRGLIPAELGKGFGFLQSKPPCAFSPVAITPDELGAHWKDGLVHLALQIDYNGKPFGRPLAHKDATFSLARLVSHAAKTRPLTAGTIVGSGTVSNKGPDGDPGKPVSEGGLGYSCIAEIRMIEKIATGEFVTPFMSPGDTVKIEMLDDNGQSIFGSIENEVKAI